RLTATGNEGYRFVRWTKGGAEVSTANPYTFECTGEAELVAVFEKVEATGLLGIHREGLSVYPNPTTGELWLTVPEPVEVTAEVKVYTASGQLVVRVPVQGTSTGSAPAATGRIRIDLSSYPTGVYIIRVGNAVARVVRL
ncbi:MAG: T9SS type A sorting domain-containing protein, partial [Bacteroidales bacterium]|nr:T9SS type A sorting domain-containing protein [Bacteroidales bacterium]